METKDWKAKETAKILLIGHVPILNESDTIAQYVLFADYYFKPIPSNQEEKIKYKLAESSFNYIMGITNNKYKVEDIYITNFCNLLLKHAPKGKTVLIPQSEAEKGLKNIKKILKENPSIEYIFPMSLQVNYWLQKLGFYSSNDNFIEDTEPKIIGLENIQPYFKPEKSLTFQSICYQRYNIIKGDQKLIPILHMKSVPSLKNNKEYKKLYKRIRIYFKNN